MFVISNLKDICGPSDVKMKNVKLPLVTQITLNLFYILHLIEFNVIYTSALNVAIDAKCRITDAKCRNQR